MPALHPTLDHIVILVPASALASLPAWLISAFTVVNGGTHADGKTSNKLIVFADGTYLELIAFTEGLDLAERRKHRWGQRPEGTVIDWALTVFGSGEPERTFEEFEAVRSRVDKANAGIVYSGPVPGGRKRPDGVELAWATAAPLFEERHSNSPTPIVGELPFWCLDRTPRSLRVPSEDQANITHPSEAVGLGAVAITVGDAKLFEDLKRVYSAVTIEANSGGDGQTGWNLLPPFAQSKTLPKVQLCQKNGVADVHIQLTFFTTGKEHSISGSFVDGQKITFKFIRLPA